MPVEMNGEKALVFSAGSENDSTTPDEDILDDLVRGMMYATVAITDDNEGTLRTISKASPWQTEAMKLVTGGSKRAHMPLSEILRETMGLELDYRLDVSGVTIGGVVLNTQGYIAHNEKCVVLSYSSAESAFDWLENFSTSTCVFDPEADLEIEYSPFFSGFEGMCAHAYDKARVHKEFYNNFLASVNMVKMYIDPFLQSDRRPRKLFITGHSLGAGIATLAASYFLLSYDWDKLPHTLVSVTAGSPRVCCKSMIDIIDDRCDQLGESARFYRLVKGKDLVTTVPSTTKDFHHVGPPVYISDRKQIIMKTEATIDNMDVSVLKELSKARSSQKVSSAASTGSKTKYDIFAEQIPRSLRDHLPDSYLKPLLRARAVQYGTDLEKPKQLKRVAQAPEKDPDEKSQVPRKKQRPSLKKRVGRFFKRRSRTPVMNMASF